MFKYERRQLTPQDTQRGPFCDRWTGVGGHSQGGYRNTERCCPPKLFRLSLPGPFSAKSVTYCFPSWLFKECTRYRVKILVRTLFLVQSLHHDLPPDPTSRTWPPTPGLAPTRLGQPGERGAALGLCGTLLRDFTFFAGVWRRLTCKLLLYLFESCLVSLKISNFYYIICCFRMKESKELPSARGQIVGFPLMSLLPIFLQ